jgi:hypothetical protein
MTVLGWDFSAGGTSRSGDTEVVCGRMPNPVVTLETRSEPSRKSGGRHPRSSLPRFHPPCSRNGRLARRLLQLECRDRIPSRWSILSSEVRRSYWDVLAYQHDGITEAVASARIDFTECVQRLRDAYDVQPELGQVAADEMTDRAIQQAHADFAADLARPDWRDDRTRRPPYF